MLTIEIKLNGQLIGGATALNTSPQAALSDYDVLVAEKGAEITGLGDFRANITIKQHRRRQTAWALVSKIAERAVEMRMGEGSTELAATIARMEGRA